MCTTANVKVQYSNLIQYLRTDVNTAVSTSALRNWFWADDILGDEGNIHQQRYRHSGLQYKRNYTMFSDTEAFCY